MRRDLLLNIIFRAGKVISQATTDRIRISGLNL